MFQSAGLSLKLSTLSLWIAQLSQNQGVDTPEQAALVFSGPKFFIALIAGVVLAFAFQLLLTNLSVAAGISYLGHQSDDHADSHSSSQGSGGGFGGTIRKIGFAVGLWTLITVSIALFVACLLAVKLSLIDSAVLGAIVGLVIWATYFSLLVWVSSSTVGSLVGSVVNAATSGFQSIVGTAAAALGARAVNDQVVSTAAASAAAVRRELTSAIDPISLRENIEDYFQGLKPPELDWQRIRGEFENLLRDPELRSLAGAEGLRGINRDTFVNLIGNRTDFSKRDINRIVDQLEGVWRQVVGQQPQRDVNAELLDYLKSAHPEDLRSSDLNSKLSQLIDEVRKQNKSTSQSPNLLDRVMGKNNNPTLMDRALQFGFTTLVGTVMGRTDLSDLDVEKILHQLQGLKDKATDQAGKVASQVSSQVSDKVPTLPFNPIQTDVETYLQNSYPWHLNRATIATEFRDVIYDPEADPAAVRRQLEQLNRDRFRDLLTQRGDLTPVRIDDIADQLEAIRVEVLQIVQASETHEGNQDLRSRVENYLRSTGKDELNPEGIQRDFKVLLADPSAGADVLRDRLSQLDRDTLVQLLNQRQDLSEEQVNQTIDQLLSVREQVLGESQGLQEQTKAAADTFRQRLESYLRNTHKDELNPEGIKRDLQTLLDDPQSGLQALGGRLSHIDRDTLVQLLNQRQDLSEEQINQAIDQIQSVWSSVTHAPQAAANKAKAQVDNVTSTIAEYLRKTNKEELNPEGIQRDLQTLFNNPKEGAIALRERLSQVDRDTLVQLLNQRQDLSEEQINQTIDQVQASIRTLIKAPRRFASRAQTQVQDFQTNLASYLRNTNKEELNPEGIKRDLQLLLSDPKSGFGQLGDRLSQFDRSTLVALLSQRQDMSEEEANQVIGQIESVREQFIQQVRDVQNRIQSVIDGVFARIRNYLNSLDRPELNYDGIKRDFRKLFDDPQAGFDSLRDRLSHFNRDTLVAIVSSREDISEADVNRIIDQVEGARTSVLQRAERLQQDAQRRLEEVKHQAQKQAEETRKAAGTAAWWLFGTGLVSAVASAAAGAIAVAG